MGISRPHKLREWVVAVGFLLNGALCASLYTHTHQAFFILLGTRAFITSSCYWNRQVPHRVSRRSQQLLAILSSALPFFYSTDTGHPLLFTTSHSSLLLNCIVITGILLSTWGIATLGSKFGVTPADRGVVRTGPYRFLAHPIYLGYLMCELTIALQFPSTLNLLLLGLSGAVYFYRATQESCLLDASHLERTQPESTIRSLALPI